MITHSSKLFVPGNQNSVNKQIKEEKKTGNKNKGLIPLVSNRFREMKLLDLNRCKCFEIKRSEIVSQDLNTAGDNERKRKTQFKDGIQLLRYQN